MDSPGFKKELQDLSLQFDKIISEVKDITNGISDASFNWRPSDKKWSIAECLDHLNVTASGYIENVDKMLKTSSENKTTGDQQIKFGIIGKFFKTMEPPPKFKMKAPKKLKPHINLDKTKVLKEFFDIQDKIKHFISISANMDINKLKIPSPVVSFIKIRIGEFYAFTAVHERRHIWQIKEILKAPGFPGSA